MRARLEKARAEGCPGPSILRRMCSMITPASVQHQTSCNMHRRAHFCVVWAARCARAGMIRPHRPQQSARCSSPPICLGSSWTSCRHWGCGPCAASRGPHLVRTLCHSVGMLSRKRNALQARSVDSGGHSSGPATPAFLSSSRVAQERWSTVTRTMPVPATWISSSTNPRPQYRAVAGPCRWCRGGFSCVIPGRAKRPLRDARLGAARLIQRVGCSHNARSHLGACTASSCRGPVSPCRFSRCFVFSTTCRVQRWRRNLPDWVLAIYQQSRLVVAA